MFSLCMITQPVKNGKWIPTGRKKSCKLPGNLLLWRDQQSERMMGNGLQDRGDVPGPPQRAVRLFPQLGKPLCGCDGGAGCDGAGGLVRTDKGPASSWRCFTPPSRAANSVQSCGGVSRGEQVVEYDCCPSSHTVALPDGTYCYCRLWADAPFAEFLPYASAEQERAKYAPSLEEGDAESPFFLSCVPWFSYTALTRPRLLRRQQPADYLGALSEKGRPPAAAGDAAGKSRLGGRYSSGPVLCAPGGGSPAAGSRHVL